MFLVETNLEEINMDCPVVIEWINLAKKFIIKDDSFDDSKIKVMYLYGYFVNKTNAQDVSKMIFDERLVFELSKIRIDVSLSIGKFIMKNRLPSGTMPKPILDLATEITKIKMMVEGSDNIDVYNSIPPLSNLISVEFTDDDFSSYFEEELDIDEILDKISKNGMESLSIKEKEFLDKRSKDI